MKTIEDAVLARLKEMIAGGARNITHRDVVLAYPRKKGQTVLWALDALSCRRIIRVAPTGIEIY